MPIIKGTGRINPLDLDRNFTIGLEFPLNEENLFSGTETTADQARANLIDILLTYPGERINLPNFGVGLRNLLFESQIDVRRLESRIEDQVKKYVPTVTLVQVTTEFKQDEHILSIFLEYIYNPSQETDAIQLNFNAQP